MRKSLFWTLDHHPQLSNLSLADMYTATHEYAKLADELGYDCLWLGEHHFLSEVGSIPNPAVLLSSLAQCTTNIRLGAAVAVLPMREGILTAENYTMLDIISGGRLNMGVGTGQVQGEYELMGADFEGRRLAFEQNLNLLLDYWCQSDTLQGHQLNIKPIQQPAPPIYVATKSVQGALQAGQSGHSVLTIISPMEPDLSALSDVMQAHNQGGQSNLRAQDTEVVVTVFAHAADSEEQAIQNFKQAICTFRPDFKQIEDLDSAIGNMIDKHLILLGNQQQVLEQLNFYKVLGVKHINLLLNFGGLTPQQVSDSIRLFAPDKI